MTSAVAVRTNSAPVAEIHVTPATRNVLAIAAITAAVVAVASLMPSLVLGVLLLGAPIALVAVLSELAGAPRNGDPEMILTVLGVPGASR